jgi:hypothetical protein
MRVVECAVIEIELHTHELTSDLRWIRTREVDEVPLGFIEHGHGAYYNAFGVKAQGCFTV